MQKYLNKSWFDKSSRFKHLSCYINDHIDDIENILANFNNCLPDVVSYSVVNLNKSNKWKAKQRHHWIYLFGPGILLMKNTEL